MSDAIIPPLEPLPVPAPKKQKRGKRLKLKGVPLKKKRKPYIHYTKRVGAKGNKAHLKYKAEFENLAYSLALADFSDAEIAANLNVRPETIVVWKKTHPLFAKALEDGRGNVIGKVANALTQAAIGYSHPDVQIFCNTHTGRVVEVPTVKYYPPSVAAGLAILRQRTPNGKWRDKSAVELTGANGVLQLQPLVIAIHSSESPPMKMANATVTPAPQPKQQLTVAVEVKELPQLATEQEKPKVTLDDLAAELAGMK